jgi:hypothetical protein
MQHTGCYYRIQTAGIRLDQNPIPLFDSKGRLMELQNMTIAITGGGRGLGAAMALRLAAQGCQLALIDVDEAALEETRAACEEAGSPKALTTSPPISRRCTAWSTTPASRATH